MNKCWKDSGISFFEKIPSHWDVVRFEDIFQEEKKKLGNEKELELLTLSKKYGVIYRKESVGDVDENILSRAESFEDYKVVYPKMLVMNIMLTWDGVLDFSTKRGFVSPAYNVFKSKYDISYFKYLLKTNLMHAYFRTESKGITDFRLRLYSNNFLKMKVFIPPLVEQESIVSYLDTETSKIDRKISILEQKYEKLEEYKQSVIFETVTKGLDGNVEMKDSGIDWIGDVPKHWEVKRVKDISKIKKGKAVETYLEKSDEMLPCIDTNFLRGRDNIVFCKNGTKINSEKVLILWDGANAGELFFNKEIGYLGSTFGVFNTNINNKYWFYYLKGIEQYSRDNLTGMGIPHVDGTVLKQTIGLVPPKKEQENIASFLDAETSKINKKKENIAKRIELLKEYKQTIIYEAVTGKMEIL